MDERALSAGEVAAKCGVSVDTIRHYEARGVIVPAQRMANGYRRWPEDVVGQVNRVRRAIAIGFTLDEIARLFRARAAGKPPCREVRALASRKLEHLDERIASMLRLRTELAGIVAEWDERLAFVSDGQPAYLLDSLRNEVVDTDQVTTWKSRRKA